MRSEEKILVLGANGLLGRHVVDDLQNLPIVENLECESVREGGYLRSRI